MKLNCDLGEGLFDVDALVMPLLDMANIACGGHYGNEESMNTAVALAKRHRVEIGAHPSYPDPQHFGRVSLDIPLDALAASITQQITSLSMVCDQHGTHLSYIKPHGALYNDLLHKPALFEQVADIALAFSLPLLIQSSPRNDILQTHADQRSAKNEKKLKLIFEGFADRAYTDKGTLVARKEKHAVHPSLDTIVRQAIDFAEGKGVMTESGQHLALSIDSLCVHSDTDDSVAAIHAIRDHLKRPHEE